MNYFFFTLFLIGCWHRRKATDKGEKPLPKAELPKAEEPTNVRTLFFPPVKRKHTDSKDFISFVSHSPDCLHKAILNHNHNLSIALVAYPALATVCHDQIHLRFVWKSDIFITGDCVLSWPMRLFVMWGLCLTGFGIKILQIISSKSTFLKCLQKSLRFIELVHRLGMDWI